MYRLTEQLLDIALQRSEVQYVTFQLTEFDNYLNLIIEADGWAENNQVFPNSIARKDISIRLAALHGTASIDTATQQSLTIVIEFYDPKWATRHQVSTG